MRMSMRKRNPRKGGLPLPSYVWRAHHAHIIKSQPAVHFETTERYPNPPTPKKTLGEGADEEEEEEEKETTNKKCKKRQQDTGGARNLEKKETHYHAQRSANER